MPAICNRQYGGSVRDCLRCKLPGRWLECPPEARGRLVPASVAAASLPPVIGFAALPTQTAAQATALARAKGYTGTMCDGCGSFNMKRNGACEVCDDCGHTGGCS